MCFATYTVWIIFSGCQHTRKVLFFFFSFLTRLYFLQQFKVHSKIMQKVQRFSNTTCTQHMLIINIGKKMVHLFLIINYTDILLSLRLHRQVYSGFMLYTFYRNGKMYNDMYSLLQYYKEWFTAQKSSVHSCFPPHSYQ